MVRKAAGPKFQTANGIWGSVPILKQVFLSLTLGRGPLKIWVFVANITNEFILGLEILRPYNASVNIGRQTLRLAEEEISLWSPAAGTRPSNLVMAKDLVIHAQCEGIVMARLQRHLGVENELIEPGTH
jgi:hypothetical protein